MKHYPHHIGDFDKATRHLTRIERSVYRDLIELYYDIEKQLPLDAVWICRRIIARSNEESTAVEQTLNEFFTKTPTGWYHDRCESEIEHYRSNNSQKAQAGKASAAARALKKQQAMNACSTDVGTYVQQTSNGTPTNQEPVTSNQEPERDKTARASRMPADQALNQDWFDFCKTERPDLDPIATFEKFKDYWTAKPGKAGTKLDWLATWRNWVREEKRQPAAFQVRQQPKSFAESDREVGMKRWEQQTGRIHPDRAGSTSNVIDITPSGQLIEVAHA